MSEERKKLLWISVSACVFGLVLIGAGFFLFAPRSGGAAAPATIGNIAAPKAQFPQDFLSAPLPAPAVDQPRTAVGPDGSVYVVYGDEIPQGQGGPLSGALPAAPTAATGSKAAAKAPEATTPSTAAPSTAAPSTAAPKAAAKPAAEAPKAAAKAASATKSALKPKSGDYWIQAASFTSRGRADDLKDGLSQKGIASHISVKDMVGKSWYRVRVGPYATKTEAEGWLGRLKALPQCAEAYVSKEN
jgi:DedD protein